MNVLDLCSGLGGFSEAFLKRGHDVLRIDNDKQFINVPRTALQDVMRLRTPIEIWDVILVSPPCQAFSVASIKTHWTGGKKAYIPKSDFCKLSIKLIEHISEIVNQSDGIFFIENPMGLMNKMPVMNQYHMDRITYCRYGEIRMKPTDIWHNSKTWQPRSKCRNGGWGKEKDEETGKVWILDEDGNRCHEEARRGAKTGTQGLKNSTLRALIPYELSLEICIACEKEKSDGGK